MKSTRLSKQTHFGNTPNLPDQKEKRKDQTQPSFFTVQAMKAKRRNAWSIKLSLANGLIECRELGLPTCTLRFSIDRSSRTLIDALDMIPPWESDNSWELEGFENLHLFGEDKYSEAGILRLKLFKLAREGERNGDEPIGGALEIEQRDFIFFLRAQFGFLLQLCSVLQVAESPSSPSRVQAGLLSLFFYIPGRFTQFQKKTLVKMISSFNSKNHEIVHIVKYVKTNFKHLVRCIGKVY